jgi:CRISPR-associated endonuclease/helicase Cas3
MLADGGRVFSFFDERELLDYVHRDRESQTISNIRATFNTLRTEVNQAIDDPSLIWRTKLVRDIDSVSLLITDKPAQIEWNREPEMLSVPRSSLWQLEKSFRPGDVFFPVEPDDGVSPWEFEWEVVDGLADAIKNAWLLCLSPRVAHYSPEIGLLLGEEVNMDKAGRYGGATGQKGVRYRTGGNPKTGSSLAYSYRCETFSEHCRYAYKAWRSSAANVKNGLRVLGRASNLTVAILEQLVDWAVILHDTGKLNTRWQAAVTAWQEDMYPGDLPNSTGEPLAHSTYEPSRDYHRQKRPKYQRGSHAPEGAFALLPSIARALARIVPVDQLVKPLSAVLVTAIARHHSTYAYTLEDVEWEPTTVDYLNKTLKDMYGGKLQLIGLGSLNGQKQYRDYFAEFLIKASNKMVEEWMPLYWFIVRQLRLADQRSQRLRQDKEGGVSH